MRVPPTRLVFFLVKTHMAFLVPVIYEVPPNKWRAVSFSILSSRGCQKAQKYGPTYIMGPKVASPQQANGTNAVGRLFQE